MKSSTKNARIIAMHVLSQVIDHHRSLTAVLSNVDSKNHQSSLIKELCFGTCRWYFRLAIVAEKILEKPLKPKDRDIYFLILLGLYQLLYLNLPKHVAVLETVEAAKVIQKSWATKLINGVLRNFLRQQDTLMAVVNQSKIGQYAHSAWMIDAIQKHCPENWETILTANNEYPPLCLRINRLQITQAAYLKKLTSQEIKARAVSNSPDAIILEQAKAITQLPGFDEGEFYVQDSSAQFAADLLMLAPGQRVLDACAAPGGKTTHMLETQPKLGQIVAIDKDAGRIKRMAENTRRLKFPNIIQYMTADATQTNSWWDGTCFDRVLIDAPCSGSGVIRRHPDIKILREKEDIASLSKQQYALIIALWPLLKPDGILLYGTCSIFPEENEQVIQYFLDHHADAQELKIAVCFGVEKTIGRQIYAGDENRDGFYYARLRKMS